MQSVARGNAGDWEADIDVTDDDKKYSFYLNGPPGGFIFWLDNLESVKKLYTSLSGGKYTNFKLGYFGDPKNTVSINATACGPEYKRYTFFIDGFDNGPENFSNVQFDIRDDDVTALHTIVKQLLTELDMDQNDNGAAELQPATSAEAAG